MAQKVPSIMKDTNLQTQKAQQTPNKGRQSCTPRHDINQLWNDECGVLKAAGGKRQQVGPPHGDKRQTNSRSQACCPLESAFPTASSWSSRSDSRQNFPWNRSLMAVYPKLKLVGLTRATQMINEDHWDC